MDTLVLDQSYMPINRIPWRDAVSMLLRGRAEVIEEDDSRHVTCGQFSWGMPSIIRTLYHLAGSVRRGVKFNRKNLYFRDHGKCQYCGCKVAMDDFEFEHVIPKGQGGTTCWENIVASCTKCNQFKRNRTPHQAGMTLLSKPTKPKASTGSLLMILKDTANIPRSWRDYLVSIGYWTVGLDPD